MIRRGIRKNVIVTIVVDGNVKTVSSKHSRETTLMNSTVMTTCTNHAQAHARTNPSIKRRSGHEVPLLKEQEKIYNIVTGRKRVSLL